MDKFILMATQRSGSNHLTNFLMRVSYQNFVFVDAKPEDAEFYWGTKQLEVPFTSAEFYESVFRLPQDYTHIDYCFKHFNAIKLDVDGLADYRKIIPFIEKYPCKTIFIYRDNIREKVLSELIAQQTGEWISPQLGGKSIEEFELKDIDLYELTDKVKQRRAEKEEFLKQVKSSKVLKYEEVYGENQEEVLKSICKYLDIELFDEMEFNAARNDLMISDFKYNKTYENIPNYKEFMWK